jgi:dUTP pyrophosphatase
MASGLIAVEIHRSRADDQPRDEASIKQAPPPEQAPGGAVLTAASIRELLLRQPPLIEQLLEPEVQIQPNGVDLTLDSVSRLQGSGTIALTNSARIVPERESIDPDSGGWFVLSPGTYVIRLQEIVALPRDVMALGWPRSSLLRSGAAIHTAVWDAGYRGRSEALLMVFAREGIRLARGARVLQIVFFRLEAPTHAYAGAYQGEHT